MTQLGRLYEERERKAVQEAVQETAQRVVIEDNLEEGISIERIIEKLVRKFNMTKEEAVQKIQMYTK